MGGGEVTVEDLKENGTSVCYCRARGPWGVGLKDSFKHLGIDRSKCIQFQNGLSGQGRENVASLIKSEINLLFVKTF